MFWPCFQLRVSVGNMKLTLLLQNVVDTIKVRDEVGKLKRSWWSGMETIHDWDIVPYVLHCTVDNTTKTKNQRFKV